MSKVCLSKYQLFDICFNAQIVKIELTTAVYRGFDGRVSCRDQKGKEEIETESCRLKGYWKMGMQSTGRALLIWQTSNPARVNLSQCLR